MVVGVVGGVDLRSPTHRTRAHTHLYTHTRCYSNIHVTCLRAALVAHALERVGVGRDDAVRARGRLHHLLVVFVGWLGWFGLVDVLFGEGCVVSITITRTYLHQSHTHMQ